MSSKKFEIGDLVWAKMKGYPPWPGEIIEKPENVKLKKNCHYVYFYGTNQHSWISSENIKPHSDALVKKYSNVKKRPYLAAITAIVEKNLKNPKTSFKLKTVKILVPMLTRDIIEKYSQSQTMLNDGSESKNGETSAQTARISKWVKSTERMITGKQIDEENISENSYLEVETSTSNDFEAVSNYSMHTGSSSHQDDEASSVDSSDSDKLSIVSTNQENEILSDSSMNFETSSTLKNKNLSSANFETSVVENEIHYSKSPLRITYLENHPRVSRTMHETNPFFLRSNVRAEDNLLNLQEQINEPDQINEPNQINEPDQINLTNVLGNITNIPSPDDLYIPTLNFNLRNINLPLRNIQPTDKKIGVIGLGEMGLRFVKNLIESGHNVTVWNRSHIKYCEIEDREEVTVANTAADVVEKCDIIFCCLSDGKASQEVFFKKHGIYKGLLTAESKGNVKGVVEMTSMLSQISKDLHHNVKLTGSKYLEAQLYGTRSAAERGELLITASGDEQLFKNCKSCFDAFAKKTKFVGTKVGAAAIFNMLLHTLKGILYSSLGEAFSLVERLGLKPETLMHIMATSNVPFFHEEVDFFNSYEGDLPIKTVQRNISNTLQEANIVSHMMPITSAANGVYQFCLQNDYSDEDISYVKNAYKTVILK